NNGNGTECEVRGCMDCHSSRTARLSIHAEVLRARRNAGCGQRLRIAGGLSLGDSPLSLEAHVNMAYNQHTLPKGVYSLLLTPYQSSGEIDYSAYERYVDWQLSHSPQALFAACGSSELLHLTAD